MANSISPARRAAFAALLAVESEGVHSDDALHGPLLAGLSQQDRNLATALVLGTLRWSIALEARLLPLLSRQDVALAPPVALALKLGAFQLLYLERIPAHAALNESVELARVSGHAHAAGMVNAVLRKLTTAPAPRKPLVESTTAMAERLAHPAWLVDRWAAQYGRAVAERLCEHDQREPVAPTLFEPSEAMPLIDDGSRLVAELAAASQPGAHAVWDACAAPGGKTLVLAARLPQAKLLATDVSPRRLRRLSERLKRERPDAAIETAVQDASIPSKDDRRFDLILCDLPCSGTGTLARNPEIRLRLERAELTRQSLRQEAIVRASLDRLAPGGRLLYSTCSMESEENERVIERVIGAGAGRIVPLDVALASVPRRAPLDPARLLSGPFLRTLPGSGFEGDGFFAALLELA